VREEQVGVWKLKKKSHVTVFYFWILAIYRGWKKPCTATMDYTGTTTPTQHLVEVNRVFDYIEGFSERYDRYISSSRLLLRHVS
jgi:hypothetical protein